MTESYAVVNVVPSLLEVRGVTTDGVPFVAVTDGDRTTYLDLGAARRLARVLVQAAEDAESGAR